MSIIFPLVFFGQINPQSFEGSVRQMIFQASPLAKLVLLILLLFSVFSWAIIIDKFRSFRAVEHENERFLRIFKAQISSLDHVYNQSQKFRSIQTQIN